MRERKVSKIFCIVHPFSGRRLSAKTTRTDLGYWKAVVDKVSGDSSAMLVGVLPFEGQAGLELRRYAEERLGDRFKPRGTFSYDLDRPVSKKARIFACGRIYNLCVSGYASSLAEKLGIPGKRVFMMPDLSHTLFRRKDRRTTIDVAPGSFVVAGKRLRESAKDAIGSSDIRAPATRRDLWRMRMARGFSVVPRGKFRRRG